MHSKKKCIFECSLKCNLKCTHKVQRCAIVAYLALFAHRNRIPTRNKIPLFQNKKVSRYQFNKIIQYHFISDDASARFAAKVTHRVKLKTDSGLEITGYYIIFGHPVRSQRAESRTTLRKQPAVMISAGRPA